MKKEHMMLILVCLIFPITIILHIVNFILIATRKKLHKPCYYIIVNLSVADIALLLSVGAQLMSEPKMYFLVIHRTVATVSTISMLGMAADRFVAVIYCMRYTEIVTTKRLVLFLLLIWIVSFLLSVIPLMVTRNMQRVEFYGDCILVPTYCIVCVLCVTISLWIRNVRNKHVAIILKRNIHFGVQDEKLTILQSLKTSILDIIKLSFFSSVLLLNTELFRLIWVYSDKSSVTLSVLVGLWKTMYVVSNPIVYIISNTGLKKEYKHLCKRNNVHVDETPQQR